MQPSNVISSGAEKTSGRVPARVVEPSQAPEFKTIDGNEADA